MMSKRQNFFSFSFFLLFFLSAIIVGVLPKMAQAIVDINYEKKYPLSWKTNLGKIDKPALTVKLGEKVDFKVETTGDSKTQITCLNCKTGATVDDLNNGSAVVKWDLSGADGPWQGIELQAYRPADGMYFDAKITGTLVIKVDCTSQKDETACDGVGQFCIWVSENKTCKKKEELTAEEKKAAILEAYADQYKMPEWYDGPLPECAFTGQCKDVNDLLQLAVNIANWAFRIIGSLAFVIFIYGGFTMVLSFGNAEKVKKAQGILVGAAVGLTIAFSAYLMVNFVLDAFQVSDLFTQPFQ